MSRRERFLRACVTLVKMLPDLEDVWVDGLYFLHGYYDGESEIVMAARARTGFDDIYRSALLPEGIAVMASTTGMSSPRYWTSSAFMDLADVVLEEPPKIPVAAAVAHTGPLYDAFDPVAGF